MTAYFIYSLSLVIRKSFLFLTKIKLISYICNVSQPPGVQVLDDPLSRVAGIFSVLNKPFGKYDTVLVFSMKL